MSITRLKRQNQDLNGLNEKRSPSSFLDAESPVRHSFLREGQSLTNGKAFENLRLLLDQQKKIQQLNDMINSKMFLNNNRDYSLED